MHKPLKEKLSSNQNCILWKQHGLEIKVPQGTIPAGHEVEIEMKLYKKDDPRFIFPQGYPVCSNVYEIHISNLSAFEFSPAQIELILTKFDQPKDGASCCVLRASCNADKWKSDLRRPEHVFDEMQGAKFDRGNKSASLNLKVFESGCFLAVASK